MTKPAANANFDARRTQATLERVANKWTVLILSALCPAPVRFNELQRRLEGITHKALSDALKRMERDGLVSRRVLVGAAPVGVEYAISDLGLSLRAPFLALHAWAVEHGRELERRQLAFDSARQAQSVEAYK